MRSSNDHTQPMPKQTEHFNEQFILLAAQGVSVHERRRILRDRQRIPALTALSLLVIPHPSEKGEVHEDSGCLSPGSSEEPRSRFSHSSPPSPVAMDSPVLLAPPAPSSKRKSMLAKLKKAFVP